MAKPKKSIDSTQIINLYLDSGLMTYLAPHTRLSRNFAPGSQLLVALSQNTRDTSPSFKSLVDTTSWTCDSYKRVIKLQRKNGEASLKNRGTVIPRKDLVDIDASR
jgi:hypothetical protein